MDEILKEALGTVTLKRTGKGGGGCINEGEAYLIDTGTVFVKYNKKPQVNYIHEIFCFNTYCPYTNLGMFNVS